jgi:dipeptidase E
MPQTLLIAMGGGGFSDELLRDELLRRTRSTRPRVCFIPTASGDSQEYIARFYRAFSQLDCTPSDLTPFNCTVGNLEEFILSQDLVYAGGGNTANLLAVWRAHGLDQVLRRAWQEGVVISGISAGMNCWFEQSLSDSFHAEHFAPLHDGLGFLPGSTCPHYDVQKPEHRHSFQQLIGAGGLADGWGVDEGAALVFADGALTEVIASRPHARAYRVERQSSAASERQLDTRYLG